MTNTAALREKIASKGLKIKYVAEQVGLSPYGLTLEIDGKNEFRSSEIKALAEVLSLNSKDVFNIFFAD